jgi:CheY-like chemotaxis protein
MDTAETVEHGLSDTSSNKAAQDTAQARPDSIAPSASPLPDTDEAIETLLARISARSAAGQAAGQEEGGPAPTAAKALAAKRVDAATAPSRQHTASTAPAGAVATAGRHPAGQTAELPPPASPPAEDPVVLLVEDEAPVRAFASRALRLHGFSVLEAASAEDALELLRDPGLRVDVFLTDVVMPGLDGPGWVREALVTRPGVPVVFMSGYAEDALAEARMEIEGAQFLAKPFTLADLTRTVTALVT